MLIPPLYIYIYLARTPEIGQGLGRILSCGARKPEQTYSSIRAPLNRISSKTTYAQVTKSNLETGSVTNS